MSYPTTAQSFGALLKSTRDIMRKDIHLRQRYGGQEGLNGDLDRLPLFTVRSSRREEAQTEKSEIGNQKSRFGQSLVTSAATIESYDAFHNRRLRGFTVRCFS